MKNLLILLSILISNVIYGQIDSSRNLQVTATTLAYAVNMPRLQTYYQPTPYVNLHLSVNNGGTINRDVDSKTGFTVIFISGLAFTAAALLEGGSQYGTYVSNPQPGNPYNTTYVTPNFWQQTPRQIMLCIGVGFTFVGGIGMIKSK